MSDQEPGDPKRLVIVRHAKSSWDDAALADHDRSLAPRGRRALERLRRHLEELAPPPALVLCSSALRTIETLEGIRPALGDDAEIEVDRSLYGTDAEALLRRLRRVEDTVPCVVLVGHNPGCEDLTELLADLRSSVEQLPEKFPTAAVASLSFTGPWSDLRPSGASLDDFWTPRGAST